MKTRNSTAYTSDFLFLFYFFFALFSPFLSFTLFFPPHFSLSFSFAPCFFLLFLLYLCYNFFTYAIISLNSLTVAFRSFLILKLINTDIIIYYKLSCCSINRSEKPKLFILLWFFSWSHLPIFHNMFELVCLLTEDAVIWDFEYCSELFKQDSLSRIL